MRWIRSFRFLMTDTEEFFNIRGKTILLPSKVAFWYCDYFSISGGAVPFLGRSHVSSKGRIDNEWHVSDASPPPHLQCRCIHPWWVSRQTWNVSKVPRIWLWIPPLCRKSPSVRGFVASLPVRLLFKYLPNNAFYPVSSLPQCDISTELTKPGKMHLNNSRTGKDATKPHTLGALGTQWPISRIKWIISNIATAQEVENRK